jgi:hypothetical protein
MPRFARFLSLPLVLACLPLLVIWSGALATNNGNGFTGTKEDKAMAASHSKSAVPPLDAAQPEKFETATFALG